MYVRGRRQLRGIEKSEDVGGLYVGLGREAPLWGNAASSGALGYTEGMQPRVLETYREIEMMD